MYDLSQPNVHDYVESTTTSTSSGVYGIDKFGFIYETTIKEFAIEDIKEQPYFGGSNEPN